MILKTSRLWLRDFVADDWYALFAYQSDPRYLRFYPPEVMIPEESQRLVNMFIEGQRAQPRHKFQFAVILPDENRLIGNCGIRKQTPSASEADIGYEFDPEHWGRGYATEAAHEVLRFGFEQLKLHRITAECIADNIASAHVLEKIGMKLEGRLREKEYFKGRWWDHLLYGILEREWKHANRD
jgi:RimJ/RimL family protein N-acetyltransferase